MADRAIPFSDAMVAAIRDNRKTQTRRVLKEQRHVAHPVRVLRHPTGNPSHHAFEWRSTLNTYLGEVPVPYSPGDRLYVTETHYALGHWVPDGPTPTGKQKWRFVHDIATVRFDPPEEFRVSIDRDAPQMAQWYRRLGRFMFRRHSRITLTVTEVRVQRLQEISEADARAEGVEAIRGHDVLWATLTPENLFASLWNSLHGPDAWDANPWVVAVSFTVERRNIDAS